MTVSSEVNKCNGDDRVTHNEDGELLNDLTVDTGDQMFQTQIKVFFVGFYGLLDSAF